MVVLSGDAAADLQTFHILSVFSLCHGGNTFVLSLKFIENSVPGCCRGFARFLICAGICWRTVLDMDAAVITAVQ